jgi:hypothetical protein
MQDHSLPFPRGTTYGDNVLTLTATLGQDHEGRVYEVPDSEHNTGVKVSLRVVRNLTGAAITVARRFCEMTSAASLDFGRKCAAFGGDVSAQGAVAKPLDDAYPLGMSIPANDLFYVGEEGPFTVLTESGAVNLAPGAPVACNADGTVDGTAAQAGEYVCGSSTRLANVLSEDLVIHVNAGLLNEGA